MNDQLQQALAAMLGKTVNAVGVGVDFLSAELPEVIRQLLMWHAIKSGIIFWLATLFLVILVWAAVKLWRAGVAYKQENSYDDGEQAYFAASIISSFFSLGAFFVACTNITWIQILIAPKVYLIEYAASLVKS